MKKFAAIAAILVAAQVASAGVISVNLSKDGFLDPADVAGVVPAANWNNIDKGDTPSDLLDGGGLTTTADITDSGPAHYNTDVSHGSDPDGVMLSGFTGYFGQSEGSISFAEVPYALYDVYVIWGSGRDNNSDSYSQTYIINGVSKGIAWDANTTFDGTYTESLAVDAADAAANYANHEYVVFAGLTDSAFTIEVPRNGGQQRAGISGIQIVEVPEPATMSLLALGGLAVLRRRRR